MRPEIIEGISLSLHEKVCYIAVIIGMLGDQFSTRLGLSRTGIYESNPNVMFLMQNNLWLPIDIVMTFMSVVFTALFIRKFKVEGRLIMLGFPLIFGSVRLITTIMNLLLYFS
jgi:hypothetical protein